MYRFGKAALSLTRRAVPQVRQNSTQAEFHAKYGNAVLVGGAVFCTAVWGYVLTQTGMVWNMSPVGKVEPKPWQVAEEEE